MTKETTETVTVEGDGLTVSLIVWRRFRRPMPGLVEAVYARNPRLADHGHLLPVGVSFELPVLQEAETRVLPEIKLW